MNIILWLNLSPTGFGPGRELTPAASLPSQRPARPPARCWHLPMQCLPWGMPALAILVLPALLGSGRGAEGRAGLLFPGVTHCQDRKTEKHYSAWQQVAAHWLVSSNTRLLPSQQNSSVPAVHVCVCLHAWVHANKLSKSTLSLLSVLWRCATPQILEKPCGAILLYFWALLIYDDIVSTLCNFPQMISTLFHVDSKTI